MSDLITLPCAQCGARAMHWSDVIAAQCMLCGHYNAIAARAQVPIPSSVADGRHLFPRDTDYPTSDNQEN